MPDEKAISSKSDTCFSNLLDDKSGIRHVRRWKGILMEN